MLSYVDVTNIKKSTATLRLTLANPTNGYFVKGIDGLDPVKATLVSSTFANLDGEQYHGGSRDVRNLRVILGLRSKTKSVALLREELYEVFMPKTEIALSFVMADGSIRLLQGVVETCEAPLFTKEPEMAVSILCYKPNFSGPTATVFSGVSGGDSDYVDVVYPGTVPVGFQFSMTASSSIASISVGILTEPDPEVYILYTGYPLLSGDTVKFHTARGERAVLRNSGASWFAAFHNVSPSSGWPELYPGVNKLRVYTPTAGVPYTITYTPKYGGL